MLAGAMNSSPESKATGIVSCLHSSDNLSDPLFNGMERYR